MTPRGSFVINGAERIVVSQLHRSPEYFLTKFSFQMEQKFILLVSYLLKVHGLNLQQILIMLMYAYIDRKKSFL